MSSLPSLPPCASYPVSCSDSAAALLIMSSLPSLPPSASYPVSCSDSAAALLIMSPLPSLPPSASYPVSSSDSAAALVMSSLPSLPVRASYPVSCSDSAAALLLMSSLPSLPPSQCILPCVLLRLGSCSCFTHNVLPALLAGHKLLSILIHSVNYTSLEEAKK